MTEIDRNRDGNPNGTPGEARNSASGGESRLELERRRDELAFILENAPFPMVISDRDSRVVVANKAARDKWADGGLLAGTCISELLRCASLKVGAGVCGCGPECGECSVRAALQDTIEHGTTRDREEHQVLSVGEDGVTRTRHVIVSSLRVPLEHPRPAALVTLEDITHQREVEAQLRFQSALLDQIGDLVTATDLDGRITYVNEANCKALGRKRGDLVGLSVHEFGEDPSAGPTQQHIIDETREKGEWRAEMVNFTPKGERVVLDARTWVFRDESGKPAGLCGVSTDITDRKRTEEALRASEERLALAMLGASDGLWDWNLETDEVYYSPRWKSMLGYDDREIEAHISAWERLVRPEDRVRTMELLDRYIKGEIDRYEIEFQMRHKDGQWGDILSRGVLMRRDEDGKPVRLVGTHTDVTERRRAERALKESEERLDLVLRGASLGIWDWDVVTGGVVFNDRWAEMLGYRLEEIEPNVGTWDALLHPDDKAAAWEALTSHVQGRSSRYEVEYRLRHKTGAWVWILDKGEATHRDENGRATRVCGTHLDITDRKRAEQAMRSGERNFTAFFNTIKDFLFVLDMQGNIIRANRTVYERLGYAEAELAGQPVSIVHPKGRIEEVRTTVRAMLEGERESCLIPIVTQDGHEIPVETYVVPGEWNDRPVLFGVSKDISELRLSEERFAAAFHSNGAAMALLTLDDGIFVDVNESFVATLGCERDGLIGRNASDTGFLVDQVGREQIMDRLRQDGKVRGVELEIRHSGGSVLHGVFAADIIDVRGVPHLLTVLNDITDRKQAEEALRESERQLARAQAIAHIGNYSHDLLTGEMVWSDELKRIVGRPDVVPTPDLPREVTHPDDRDSITRTYHDTSGSLPNYEQEFRLLRPDGVVRWCRDTAEVEFGEDGLPVRVFGTIQDITDARAAEDALRESERQLARAQAMAHIGNYSVRLPSMDSEWSAELKRIIGRPDAQASVQLIAEAIHPDDRERVIQATRRARRDVEGYEHEFRIVRSPTEPSGGVTTGRKSSPMRKAVPYGSSGHSRISPISSVPNPSVWTSRRRCRRRNGWRASAYWPAG